MANINKAECPIVDNMEKLKKMEETCIAINKTGKNKVVDVKIK